MTPRTAEIRLVLCAAVAVILVAGCNTTAGTPRPASGAGAFPGTSPSSTSTSPPARPREIELRGAEPCALLTDDQLPALQIDEAGRLVDNDFYRTKGCSWTVVGANSRLIPVTVEGISAWTDGKRAGRAAATDPVVDFPAITVTLPNDEGRCDVVVDTSDGQYLAATFSVLPTYEDRFPAPCDGARKLAEAAMENLLK
ncbi:DUF3558 domain-containing protein [Actinosynnema sp. NPDC053489]|uniref:DUF3558 domain-containing protein n=1 Tax=Actinosynnema sp. NPDC053489 TaxID=3363916 RepID=UPI0037C636DD